MARQRRGFPLLEGAGTVEPLEAEQLAWRKAESARRLLERRARAAARERRKDFGPATEALFDLVAGTELLGVVLPSGKIPGDFARRCLQIATERSGALGAEGEALRVAKGLLRGKSAWEDDREAFRARIGSKGWTRLARLARAYQGEPEEGLRGGELTIPGTPWIVRRGGDLERRDTIPGSGILLGSLVSGRNGLRVQARGVSARARGRLGRALGLLDQAWPEAGEEVRARTRLVLTLDEPGLVSYSHLDRPGVSYINLRGKRTIDLADDLLHETAHHRLHAIEHETPLFPRKRKGGGEEVRYWSPWRRALRPVRGIYHAVYTFSFRAELFRRILDASRSDRLEAGLRLDEASTLWLRAQAAGERAQIRRALQDLAQASRNGLLTAAGRRLLARIRIAHAPARS